METAAHEVLRRGALLGGVTPGDGAFAPGPALWVGRREVAHVDRDGRLDLRMTRSEIRARRADLRADDRVELRDNGSDWLSLSVTEERDVTDALEFLGAAVAANTLTAEPGPPPRGADLERRRRFH